MKKVFLLIIVACLGLALEKNASAQTFTTLHGFTNLDGGLPEAGVIVLGDTIYGTTTFGGSFDDGVVFKVNTDGTGFTQLHVFAGGTDGSFPYSGLLLCSNILYGTTHGDEADNGTIFAINTDGSGFTNLHTFSLLDAGDTNIDGGDSFAGLIVSNGILYGTASRGSTNGNGVVFAINTDSTGYTILHAFTGDDGANPVGSLLLYSNVLYGTTGEGGSGGSGTIFTMSPDGTEFTNIYNFTATSVAFPNTNKDGAFPQGGFVSAGNMLYATALGGGLSGNGTVFAIGADGNGFTNLYNFTPLDPVSDLTNSDGAVPYDNLVLAGGNLYGTTSTGGKAGNGTVFAVNTNGTGFTVLYTFQGTEDGGQPFGGLTLANDILYGMGQYGGSSGYGTVFSLSYPLPQLGIALSGTNVILTWPTNVQTFDQMTFNLQSSTNPLSSPAWTSVSPGPVVLGGQNTVTNPISGPLQFFRLSQ